jgi:FMN phosphatase YigB (HAD superfamily)
MPPTAVAVSGAIVQIATFDFHNTVARCDTWFELEIRELPAAVLGDVDGHEQSAIDIETRQRAVGLYRELRTSIMASGIEMDAQASVEHVLDAMGIAYDPDVVASSIERHMRGAMHDLAPIPGAVETISTLLDAGTPIGIISSAVYHPFLEWTLDAFGLLDRLAFVATSASVGYYKSDVRIYRNAYRAANATIAQGVHIGDSPRWDVATAQEAGLGTVLYAAGPHTHAHEIEDVEPDLVLESLIDAHQPIMRLLAQRRGAQVAP